MQDYLVISPFSQACQGKKKASFAFSASWAARGGHVTCLVREMSPEVCCGYLGQLLFSLWKGEPAGGALSLSCPFPSSFMVSMVELWASLVAEMVNSLPTMQETWVRSLGREDPLEKGMALHSSILAWRIPWTERPGGLQSMGSQSLTWLGDYQHTPGGSSLWLTATWDTGVTQSSWIRDGRGHVWTHTLWENQSLIRLYLCHLNFYYLPPKNFQLKQTKELLQKFISYIRVCVCVCVWYGALAFPYILLVWFGVSYTDLFHSYVLSHVSLFVTPWTVVHQSPLSMGFLRPE